MFPVAEAEVVAAFAEEFAAVVIVGLDVATEAEVIKIIWKSHNPLKQKFTTPLPIF